MKRFIGTVLGTIIIMTLGIIGFLMYNGCLTFETYETTHNRVVIEDGVEIENTNWDVLEHLNVRIKFNDSATLYSRK